MASAPPASDTLRVYAPNPHSPNSVPNSAAAPNNPLPTPLRYLRLPPRQYPPTSPAVPHPPPRRHTAPAATPAVFAPHHSQRCESQSPPHRGKNHPQAPLHLAKRRKSSPPSPADCVESNWTPSPSVACGRVRPHTSHGVPHCHKCA